MNKIRDQKIEIFLDELSSASPTPGGGAVAALSGAMAASLVEMVCGLTIGKKGYEKIQIETKLIKSKAANIKRSFLELADEDIFVFNQVMLAYKKGDKAKIKTALKGATDVPAKVGRLADKIAYLAIKMAKVGNKNAVSDAKSALYLARASKKAALENVKINLKALAALS